MKQIKLAFLMLMMTAIAVLAAPVRIHLVGDSICAGSSRPPRTGWGTALAGYTLPGFDVENRARSGLSTSSCRTKTDYQGWAYVTKPSYFRPGDYVVLNFGHNNRRKNISMEQYADDLTFFIRDAKSKGVNVVLTTPIEERVFKNGAFVGGKELKEYAKYVYQVAEAEKVPVIDLNALSTDDILTLGEEKSHPYYLSSASKTNDNSHLTQAGAKWIAEMFLREAARQQLPITKCFRSVK